MTKLIIGCGYLGRRIAGLWLQAGHKVVGVTRTEEAAERLRCEGIEALVADITAPATLGGLPHAETVVFAVSYNAASALARRDFLVKGLRAVIDAVSPKTERFILISSTAVYGQNGGQWVDEDSPCEPKTESGHALLEAESVLADSHFGPRAIILRLAGIYGPGRLIRRTSDLISGNPIVAAEDRYLNLIHVDDAAAIVAAADEYSKPPRIYAVSDGQPVKTRDYIAHLARLMRAAVPGFIEPADAESRRNRSSGNKRVSNARMLQELAFQLKFPRYVDGLDSICSENRADR
jgi:nucleoside-diphosphate-sugar epimerase